MFSFTQSSNMVETSLENDKKKTQIDGYVTSKNFSILRNISLNAND